MRKNSQEYIVENSTDLDKNIDLYRWIWMTCYNTGCSI